MILALHGGGGDHNSVFTRAGDALKAEAEARGYIIVAPMGFTPLGGYGTPFEPPPMLNGAKLPSFTDDPRVARLSDADTLEVLDRTLAEYGADTRRVYVMGNSMGGAGTWYLAEKYPERWAAVSPSYGPLLPSGYPFARLKGEAILAVHGAKDTLAPIAVTEEMVAHAKAAGAEAVFLPVPEGDHGGAWIMSVGRIFDFFDSHPGRRS